MNPIVIDMVDNNAYNNQLYLFLTFRPPRDVCVERPRADRKLGGTTPMVGALNQQSLLAMLVGGSHITCVLCLFIGK